MRKTGSNQGKMWYIHATYYYTENIRIYKYVTTWMTLKKIMLKKRI